MYVLENRPQRIDGDLNCFLEMEFLMKRTILAALVMFAVLAFTSQSASAQIGEGNLPNYLFSQYTTQGQGGATAGKYPAPHPVPSYVGESYYTYQPLMPHEMMYEHQRNYYNYYNDGSFKGGGPSLNVTSVRWQNGSTGGYRPLPLSNYYLSKLQYGLASRAYCLGGDCGLGIGGGGGLGIGGGGGFGGGGGLKGRLKGRCASGHCN